MSGSWRRYEILFPLRHNDGSPVPEGLLAEALRELENRIGAASHETQTLEGRWRHGGLEYRDTLARIFVDAPDVPSNREWMRDFKRRWMTRLGQIELWMTSHPIDLE